MLGGAAVALPFALLPGEARLLFQTEKTHDIDGDIFQQMEGGEEERSRLLPLGEHGERLLARPHGEDVVEQQQDVQHAEGNDDEIEDTIEHQPPLAAERVADGEHDTRADGDDGPRGEQGERNEPVEAVLFRQSHLAAARLRLFADALAVLFVALDVPRQPAHPAVVVVAVAGRLLGVEHGIRPVHGLVPHEHALHLQFVVLRHGAVGPAAQLPDELAADHHALSAHGDGDVLCGAVAVAEVVQHRPGKGGVVGKDGALGAVAQPVLHIFAGDVDVVVEFERVVELAHIGGGEHAVRIHDDEGVVALKFLRGERLEVAVQRVPFAALVGNDVYLRARRQRHGDGGVVLIFHDDVDGEFPVIVLPRDGGEQIADDLALVAGGHDEGDPAPLFRLFVGRLLEGVKEPRQSRNIRKERDGGYDDIGDEEGFVHRHGRKLLNTIASLLYPLLREKATVFKIMS